MKNYFHYSVCIIFSLVILSSCTSIKNTIDKNDSEKQLFLESVALIQKDAEKIKDDQNENVYLLKLEIRDFSKKVKLKPAYIVENIEYCDNGKYNDKIANDGIYTSVSKYVISDKESINLLKKTIINKSQNFRYNDRLDKYVYGISVEVGCDVKTVTCPETSWYNECWFGSPCTCIEFSNCKASIKYETSIPPRIDEE